MGQRVLDKNLIVSTEIEEQDICWHDIREGSFSLHGIYKLQADYGK